MQTLIKEVLGEHIPNLVNEKLTLFAYTFDSALGLSHVDISSKDEVVRGIIGVLLIGN